MLADSEAEGDRVAEGGGPGEPVDVGVITRIAGPCRQHMWNQQRDQTEEDAGHHRQHEEYSLDTTELGDRRRSVRTGYGRCHVRNSFLMRYKGRGLIRSVASSSYPTHTANILQPNCRRTTVLGRIGDTDL